MKYLVVSDIHGDLAFINHLYTLKLNKTSYYYIFKVNIWLVRFLFLILDLD